MNKKDNYLYICSKDYITSKAPSDTIVKHMISQKNRKFDILPSNRINLQILQKYKVICLDYLIARHITKKQLYDMLAILQISKKIIVFHLHDLHEYTFNKSMYKSKGIYGPLSKGGAGVDELYKQFTTANAKYFFCYSKCKELDNIIKHPNSKRIKKYKVIPFHISDNIFKDYKLDKIYDIVLLGSTHPRAYKFRTRLITILEVLKKRGYKVYIDNKLEYGPTIAKLLNQSWLCIATTSNFDYLVRKYFEISASKSVVLGDMNSQGKAIWANNYINITDKMTDEQIINIITTSLSNKTKLNEIANTMYKIMHDKYTYKQFVQKIYKYFETLQ